MGRLTRACGAPATDVADSGSHTGTEKETHPGAPESGQAEKAGCLHRRGGASLGAGKG